MGSAGRLHRLSKPAERWHPRCAATPGEAADPLTAAAHSLEEWSEVWQVASSKQQLPRPWLSCERPPMPPMELSRLREVSRGLKPTTGIGVDRWHPAC